LNRCCDLHTHSCFSDGTDSPGQLVEKAAALGLCSVALTDHNTVAGLPEFLEAAADKNIFAVPGVEISTGYKGKELHILGLFLAPETYGTVTEFLSAINQRKEESNRNLVHRLNRAGYALDYDEIRARQQGTVNRAVIAAELLNKGYISSKEEGFQGVLSEENGYYIPPERIQALEAISFLKSIHAVPVLAHPFLSLQEAELRSFLPEAKKAGLAAMETLYSTYSVRTAELAAAIAREYDLLQSGGSDYHGNNKSDIRLGTGKGTLMIPQVYAERLRNAI
jgi:predicted metal-dependent phosphoesterase TrpH